MKSTAIVATCALLVAALVYPGVALAKGGNGQHSVATPKAAVKAKPEKVKEQGSKPADDKQAAPKPKADQNPTKPKPKVDPKPAKAAKPKATTVTPKVRSSKNSPAKAPKTKSAKEPGQTRAQGDAPPPSEANGVDSEPVSASLPSTDLAHAHGASESATTGVIETRGVLDTIRAAMKASIVDLRALAAGMWSRLTS